MERYELIAPCHFGLEAVLKKEVVDLGYEVTEVENGRVTFIGGGDLPCEYFSADGGARPFKSGKLQGSDL